ncbi:hypothetical protein [Gulosibacter molinativorax]|uniref:Uncharacterized protein n=1 Tax=Gulosibacter molinativorax TaxID=256821 RepID=A0ABT7C4U1_9MICO|nr:hypothetical protein [Gulosibacter molinativorax]MDJ1370138.1 hypothetical protein [Gulosibacter molinativorax]QUY61549.1 Hypotetical protein [Gulosibacter molinativorax]
MPWWSWVLIWGGLVVLLLAVLVVGGFWLWRKLAAVMPEIDRLGLIQQELADLAEQSTVPYEPRKTAVLRPAYAVAAEREAFLEAREDRRDARRERKLERANALIHADPMQFRHLVDNPKKG